MIFQTFSRLSAVVVLSATTVFAHPARAQDTESTFGITAGVVNWESPHVHPLDITPDGLTLLAVNTPDNRLEVFSLATGFPVRVRSIPVGVDPVTVRIRSNTEAWVINHISDSVSIVNLSTGNVVATLKAQDEPCDVVFAGVGAAERAFVSCQVTNVVQVFQPLNLSAAPTNIAIDGNGPRSLAVSTDGSKVFAAIFFSGNKSTVLGGGTAGTNLGFPPNVVSLASGPYAGVNPPPNAGASFSPSIATPNPPPVSLIVKKNAANRWMDDNAHDWTDWVSGPSAASSGRPVGWDLVDHDIAIINTSTLGVTYASGIMNLCMSLAINPATQRLTLVGTEALNQIRFEPNVNGRFLRVNFASLDQTGAGTAITDLNPHLTYASPTVPQVDRDKSLGDPRAIVWNSTGASGYVAGLGSNSVAVIDAAGNRAAGTNIILVGEGPTGLALDPSGTSLFVLNRFDASISRIDTNTRTVTGTAAFYDPTPSAIKVGRKHLYNTRKNSGLGMTACASCHIDGKMDRIAWDLGDPAGASAALTNRNLGQGLVGLEPSTTPTPYQPYHPMKGPMTTQTMQDIIGKEPHHWRGDRLGIEEFNPAFIGLQGDDANLTNAEMQEFENFLATIHFPPNPYRNLDNSLPTSLPLPGRLTNARFGPAGQPLPVGNAQSGLALYRNTSTRLDGGAFACVTCHTLPTGAGTDMRQSGPFTVGYQPIAPGLKGERHLALVSVDGTSNVSMKIPQLRNLYLKGGFNALTTSNTSGFGVLHDGSVDSVERFVSEPVFNVTSNQQVADLTAFMLAFSGSDLPAGSATNPLEPPGPLSKDAHAAVGVQTTFSSAGTADSTLINQLIAIANTGKIGLIAKGLVSGKQRGWAYISAGNWQSDMMSQTNTSASLLALATPGAEITITAVPLGAQTRLGIDRDLDGWFDSDELKVCADPANPLSHPGPPSSADYNGDLIISVQDIFDFLTAWFATNADFNRDGMTTVQDIFDFLASWFAACSG